MDQKLFRWLLESEIWQGVVASPDNELDSSTAAILCIETSFKYCKILQLLTILIEIRLIQSPFRSWLNQSWDKLDRRLITWLHSGSAAAFVNRCSGNSPSTLFASTIEVIVQQSQNSAARGELKMNLSLDGLKEAASNLSLYDIKAGVRKVQNGMYPTSRVAPKCWLLCP